LIAYDDLPAGAGCCQCLPGLFPHFGARHSGTNALELSLELLRDIACWVLEFEQFGPVLDRLENFFAEGKEGQR
jgi:hypothetical protein